MQVVMMKIVLSKRTDQTTHIAKVRTERNSQHFGFIQNIQHSIYNPIYYKFNTQNSVIQEINLDDDNINDYEYAYIYWIVCL